MNQGRDNDEDAVIAGGTLLWCVVLVVCVGVLAEGVWRLLEWLR